MSANIKTGAGASPGAIKSANDPSEEWRCLVDGKNKQVLFRGRKVNLTAPSTDANALAAECDELVAYMPLRAAFADSIHFQALSGAHVTAAIWSAVGLTTDHPVDLKLKALRRFVLKKIDAPIVELKAEFARARPWMCCKSPRFEAMYRKDDWRRPPLAAYPSGHATLAWFWAFLLGHYFPQKQAALQIVAAQVALNREIAGLHYASDSAAGHDLARQLVNVLLATIKDAPSFEEHDAVLKGLAG